MFPQGIPPVDPDLRSDVRARLDQIGADVASRTGWIEFLLTDVLGLAPNLREAVTIPSTRAHHVAEHGVTLRPDYAIVDAGGNGGPAARLLVSRWPRGTDLERRPAHDPDGRPARRAASPIDRMAAHCRAVKVPIGLVTDSDRFVIVWAPRQAPSGYATWVSGLFGEERALLDTFVAFLGVHRFYSVAESETLEALLRESASAEQEVTDQLGDQVRRAVELLVGAFSRAHRASGLTLLTGVAPPEVYNAAVTVMMRLVVLLAAEERRLLPADDELYAESYAVCALRDQLVAEASRDGEETLEKRHTACHRLLATFRAVYGGIRHDRLTLPAYGGGLFDPDRYPFLEGRRAGQLWHATPGSPLSVDDRSVLAVLDALQMLTFRQGGVTEARRLSFRNLEVEQIGHVYEGLLDHGCREARSTSLGLTGKRGAEPEMELADLEAWREKGDEAFGEWIAENGGPSASKTVQLLHEEPDADADHRLLVACDNDEALYQRVRTYSGLLRRDLRDLPMVFLPGSLYVTSRHCLQALLQSTQHELWARLYASSMRTDLRYTPSDCFVTFPLPQPAGELEQVGRRYHDHRQSVMLARQEGLTTTYDRFHDPTETSADIVRLRDLHVEMDQAVAAAYGWTDLDLGHGFHDTRQGVRFTVSPDARQEILDRLLELNHQRYAEEVGQGLRDRRGRRKTARAARRKSRSRKTADSGPGLYDN